MNTDTNRLDPAFDPRIADWLEADPDRAPGEVVDTILAALPSVPQRRAFRVPWRFPEMSTNRIALAVLAIVLIAGGAFAWSRLPGSAGVGSTPSATPSPSPSPTPSPVASPSAAALKITPSAVGVTPPAGTYRVEGFAVPFTIRLPAGWVVQEFTRNNFVIRNANDFTTLVVMDAVYRDPCHPGTAARPLAAGADALVTALTSMIGFQLTDLRDASVGGADGKAFTLSNSYDPRADGCSDPQVLTIGTYAKDGAEARQIIGANESDPLWVVDTGGSTVLIGAPASMMEAISFEPAAPS